MNDMSSIMKNLVSYNIEFDDMGSSYGNESYYVFDLLNYIHLPREMDSNAILNDNETDTDGLTHAMFNALYAYSHDSDSSEQSRKLVEEYRKTLQVN